jgi:hypothetical protein
MSFWNVRLGMPALEPGAVTLAQPENARKGNGVAINFPRLCADFAVAVTR